MSIALLEKILAESPKFHCGETETARKISPQETYLHGPGYDGLLNNTSACYGIERELAFFLYDTVSPQNHTLEIGSGISTLVFALRETLHTAVTPNAQEVSAIREYARDNAISLERTEFAVEPSDQYLPRCEKKDLDLVLIDGKHAFPWPIIDWFYTADKLKRDGILVLDDLHMSSVAILRDFLLEDPRWELAQSIGKRTLAVRKLVDSVHDVAWHMQPYITRRYGRKAQILNALGWHRRSKTGPGQKK